LGDLTTRLRMFSNQGGSSNTTKEAVRGCGGAMRAIVLIQEPAVIDQILRHLREKGRDARAGPWATGPRQGG
jgi:hypothetical protein